MKPSFLTLVRMIGWGCLVLQGCAAGPHKGYDRAAYTTYLTHMPRSILVLPPENESVDVMAPYIYLSTVTRSLAERGYYVYPVAMVDALMKENGVPTPTEMAQVPLKKIREVINPDAVLYLTIVQWEVKYQVVNTKTIIHIRGQLVDTDSGDVLWRGEQSVTRDSDAGFYNSAVWSLTSALVDKIMASFFDYTREVAYCANRHLFNDPQRGLPIGRRHPGFLEHQPLQ